MSELHVCPQGHRWSEEDAARSSQATLPVCPVCGLPFQLVNDATYAESPDAVVRSVEPTLADRPAPGSGVASLPGTLQSVVSQQAETLQPSEEPPTDFSPRPGQAPSATFRHSSASAPHSP